MGACWLWRDGESGDWSTTKEGGLSVRERSQKVNYIQRNRVLKSTQSGMSI